MQKRNVEIGFSFPKKKARKKGRSHPIPSHRHPTVPRSECHPLEMRSEPGCIHCFLDLHLPEPASQPSGGRKNPTEETARTRSTKPSHGWAQPSSLDGCKQGKEKKVWSRTCTWPLAGPSRSAEIRWFEDNVPSLIGGACCSAEI